MKKSGKDFFSMHGDKINIDDISKRKQEKKSEMLDLQLNNLKFKHQILLHPHSNAEKNLYSKCVWESYKTSLIITSIRRSHTQTF